MAGITKNDGMGPHAGWTQELAYHTSSRGTDRVSHGWEAVLMWRDVQTWCIGTALKD